MQALAFGSAAAAALGDMHSITQHMCPEHRAPYVLGMMVVALAVGDLDAPSPEASK